VGWVLWPTAVPCGPPRNVINRGSNLPRWDAPSPCEVGGIFKTARSGTLRNCSDGWLSSATGSGETNPALVLQTNLSGARTDRFRVVCVAREPASHDATMAWPAASAHPRNWLCSV